MGIGIETHARPGRRFLLGPSAKGLTGDGRHSTPFRSSLPANVANERRFVLAGSCAATLAMAVAAWGSPLGLVMIGYSFLTVLNLLVGWVRQRSFVPLGRWTPRLAAASALAIVVYVPVLTVGAHLAWPGGGGRNSTDVFLINLGAYSGVEPVLDDWVWYQSTPYGENRIGRVVASKGQDVEWTGNQLRVGGRPVSLGTPFRSTAPPREFRYQVPDGQVLINPCAEVGNERIANPLPEGLVVVDRERIFGKPWAKFYPVNERRWLQ